ncbi:hypothetical protein K1T71_010538 [Dendrolimus kikuchii]|uniref:Uncharacterized protein n=1 Tax=Dendrolimus kikuchii TaxID=765133 RepID=A0ACC1CS15_9NEOP|nr:hypothetical protein K1T71_010538 [Dendrolimus kikuchii]
MVYLGSTRSHYILLSTVWWKSIRRRQPAGMRREVCCVLLIVVWAQGRPHQSRQPTAMSSQENVFGHTRSDTTSLEHQEPPKTNEDIPEERE